MPAVVAAKSLTAIAQHRPGPLPPRLRSLTTRPRDYSLPYKSAPELLLVTLTLSSSSPRTTNAAQPHARASSVTSPISELLTSGKANEPAKLRTARPARDPSSKHRELGSKKKIKNKPESDKLRLLSQTSPRPETSTHVDQPKRESLEELSIADGILASTRDLSS